MQFHTSKQTPLVFVGVMYYAISNYLCQSRLYVMNLTQIDKSFQ